MEVLYHERPYFVGTFPYIGLIQALYMVGTSNQSVPEMAIEFFLGELEIAAAMDPLDFVCVAPSFLW